MNARLAERQSRSALLLRCARHLREDLVVLDAAYLFTCEVTQRFLTERLDGAYHDLTVHYAAWVHAAFGLDEAAYWQFLEALLATRAAYSPLGDVLFSDPGRWPRGWQPPEDVYGAAAIRRVDRVDLALNYLRSSLGLAMPQELRPGPDEDPRKGGPCSIQRGDTVAARQAVLRRALHLAHAAHELFCPTPRGGAEEPD